MMEIALALGVVLALIAGLLGCYATEGVELDQPRRQSAMRSDRGFLYSSQEPRSPSKASRLLPSARSDQRWHREDPGRR
jgi:hypothetical protein